jgi:hypothetical protein
MMGTKSYGKLNGVRIHRLRAERALGKPLPLGVVVHHADGTKQDDAPLVICENEQYHRLLHKLLRIHQAGGNPWTDRICPECQRVLPFAQFPGGHAMKRSQARCHVCNRAHVRAANARKRTA